MNRMFELGLGGIVLAVAAFIIYVLVGLYVGTSNRDYIISVGRGVYYCNQVLQEDNILYLKDCYRGNRKIYNPTDYQIVERK